MENKYYTPTIEEFHVGFEYEVFQKGEPYNPNIMYLMGHQEEDKWFPFKFPNPFLGYRLDRMFETYKMRVKYLDREDIESFGFHTEDNGECYNKAVGFDIYGLYPFEFEKGIPNTYKITVNHQPHENSFKGIIKNKSELKKLLKQLNILEDE